MTDEEKDLQAVRALTRIYGKVPLVLLVARGDIVQVLGNSNGTRELLQDALDGELKSGGTIDTRGH